MANETRKTANFISGIVDNNPLSNSGTSLAATELASLPAVDATEHMVIVLDPLGAGNGPEIVYVTAHTAGSTGATIIRGREGTSGVSHTSVMTWVHAWTAADVMTRCTAATRPSGGGLPFEGQIIYETDTNRTLCYNGSDWVIVSGDAYTTYTPTITQGATLTKTINEAKYEQVGKTVRVWGNFAITSAGTLATAIIVTIPVAHNLTINTVIGSFFYGDADAAFNSTGTVVTKTGTGGTTIGFVRQGDPSYLGLAATPQAASGDGLSFYCEYTTA